MGETQPNIQTKQDQLDLTKMNKLLEILTGILATTRVGESIKCYQCASTEDQRKPTGIWSKDRFAQDRFEDRALSVSRSSNRDQGDSSGTAGGGRCSGGAPRCRTPGSPASATGGSWRTASTGRNVTAARTVVTQPPISA